MDAAHSLSDSRWKRRRRRASTWGSLGRILNIGVLVDLEAPSVGHVTFFFVVHFSWKLTINLSISKRRNKRHRSRVQELPSVSNCGRHATRETRSTVPIFTKCIFEASPPKIKSINYSLSPTFFAYGNIFEYCILDRLCWF